MNPIGGVANVRGRSLVKRADGAPIVAGTVTYYLIALNGANAGKWFKTSDNSWSATEETAAAMTHQADGHWTASVDAEAWTAGVDYLEYAKESGNLHVPTQTLIHCRAAELVAGYPAVSLAHILATLLTETSGGLLAAGVKKFFDVAAPTGTLLSLPAAIPGAKGGVPILDAGTGLILTGFGAGSVKADLIDAPNATAVTAFRTEMEKNGTLLFGLDAVKPATAPATKTESDSAVSTAQGVITAAITAAHLATDGLVNDLDAVLAATLGTDSRMLISTDVQDLHLTLTVAAAITLSPAELADLAAAIVLGMGTALEAVWDALEADHVIAGSFGYRVSHPAIERQRTC